MDSKKLKWSYNDDFFSKKSDVFEKVFKEYPDEKEREIQEIDRQVNLDSLVFDSEYYETLRDSILLPANGSSKIPRLVAFTSTDFNEGVSTVATKFAITLAKNSEKPILLVDTNFAKPSINTIFNVNLSPGLGDILLEGYDSTTVIQNSPVNNLYLLTAGDILTNPTTKFDSPLFDTLLSSWRSEYEFVVFDTPPMQCNMKQCDMNSSVRLASLVDGVILVIESEHVRREVAQAAKERLVLSKTNILGVVLNKTKHYIPNWLYKRL